MKWADVEQAKLKMPLVLRRDPTSGDFDDIEPDSDDEDFQHEYREVGESSNSVVEFDGIDSEPERLPTMYKPMRDKSLCISNDSEYYERKIIAALRENNNE